MSNKKTTIKAPRIIESTKPQMVVDQIRELRELGIHCIYSMKFVDKSGGKKVFQAVLKQHDLQGKSRYRHSQACNACYPDIRPDYRNGCLVMIKDFEKLRQKLGIGCKNDRRSVRKSNSKKQINRINQILMMRWRKS